MDSRKPYETPQWWPGSESREAMCCSFCGGRDHRYENCPQREEPDDQPPLDPPADAAFQAGDAVKGTAGPLGLDEIYKGWGMLRSAYR